MVSRLNRIFGSVLTVRGTRLGKEVQRSMHRDVSQTTSQRRRGVHLGCSSYQAISKGQHIVAKSVYVLIVRSRAHLRLSLRQVKPQQAVWEDDPRPRVMIMSTRDVAEAVSCFRWVTIGKHLMMLDLGLFGRQDNAGNHVDTPTPLIHIICALVLFACHFVSCLSLDLLLNVL